MSTDLLPLLTNYSSAALVSLATYHRVLPKGSRLKAELAKTLAKVLIEPERIRAQWALLTKAERALLESILRRGETVTVRGVREEMARRGLIEKKAEVGYDQYHPKKPVARGDSRRLEDLLASLILRGLVFPSQPAFTDHLGQPNALYDFFRPVTEVWVPAAIRSRLPEPPPMPEAETVTVKVKATREGSARVFQRDLYLYWSFVRDHPFTLTKKDEPHKAVLKDVNATLLARETLGKGEGEVEHPRLRFVRQLLLALDLAQVRAEGEVRVASAAPDFFTLAAAARVGRVFEIWQANAYFNELLLLPPEARPTRVDERLLTAPDLIIKARAHVLPLVAALSRAAGAEWVAFEALWLRLKEDDYEFLFRRSPARPSYYYYVSHPYAAETNPLELAFPNVHSEEDGWDKVEANFARGLVAGPLHWMGLADLGWTGAEATGAPAAFRLTPLGRWALGLGPCPDIPAEGGRVIVQPNLHIVALDPVNDALLVALDRFAERLTAERAVEYQLSRASVYAGQQAGWDVPRIKKFLAEQTGVELPANVARTLDEWQAQHERIVLRPQVALAQGPATLFDELAAQVPGAARPLPEVLLLPDSAAVETVVKTLHARNLLPILTDKPQATPGSVVADETGMVRFAMRAPSLYLHGHLAALADPLPDNAGYQITRETVQRAVRAGLTAPDILIRLMAVHRGAVPEALARRIRAWAKHYGDAALESALLLQVRDAAALAELRADAELAPLLRPFAPAPEKALVRVAPEHVEKVRALLAERGVEVGEKIK